MQKGRGVTNATAALIIILLSILLGFVVLKNANPLADTAEQGIDTVHQLGELNEQLQESP